MSGAADNKWQITLEDAGNNEVAIPFPDEVLEQLNWKLGDELHVVSIKPGELIIAKTPPVRAQEKADDHQC